MIQPIGLGLRRHQIGLSHADETGLDWCRRQTFSICWFASVFACVLALGEPKLEFEPDGASERESHALDEQSLQLEPQLVRMQLVSLWWRLKAHNGTR